MVNIREDLVQGRVDDAIDTVCATADAFDMDEELTDEEIQEAAKRLLKEFA